MYLRPLLANVLRWNGQMGLRPANQREIRDCHAHIFTENRLDRSFSDKAVALDGWNQVLSLKSAKWGEVDWAFTSLMLGAGIVRWGKLVMWRCHQYHHHHLDCCCLCSQSGKWEWQSDFPEAFVFCVCMFIFFITVYMFSANTQIEKWNLIGAINAGFNFSTNMMAQC